MKTGLLIFCLIVLTACSLPRGAALQSEILKSSDDVDAPFAVYPVTRDTVDDFANWPRWQGHISWLGNTRGPSSPVIKAGDMLDLVVWDNSENSLLLTNGAKVVNLQGMTVTPDGTVFVPYIDKIYVSGQTPDAAREKIQSRLSEILPSAQVQLNYTAGTRSTVSLVGGVNAPGPIPLPDRNFSLLNLISAGGGVPATLRNPRVKLIRGGKTYVASLAEVYSNAKYDVVMQGGDKVIVEQDTRFFQALGSTGREELIYFTKDSINALEAVSLVGGIDDNRADPKGVLVLREYAASHVRSDGRGPSRTDVVFTIDLTNADGLFSARRFLIQPEDVVLVTESPVTKAQTIFRLVGSVFGVANAAQNATK
ncbi:MAG: polysaccharide biosynthesis/export family protein [Rhodobacter sp.]|nr:polysaccharide biosynthesis/export family protein [Rhodobacter sp.]